MSESETCISNSAGLSFEYFSGISQIFGCVFFSLDVVHTVLISSVGSVHSQELPTSAFFTGEVTLGCGSVEVSAKKKEKKINAETRTRQSS